MKFLTCIILIIFALAHQTSAYDCYAKRSEKIKLMETVPDIANNLNSDGVMSFKQHAYKWKSNIETPEENITLRFKYKRTGNRDSSEMFMHQGGPYDSFMLTFKKKSMIVKIVSNNFYSYTKEFTLSSSFDNQYTWFAFALFSDRVDVYYNTRKIGSMSAQVSLKQFSYPRYDINRHRNYFNDGPIQGYMKKLQIFPDIYPESFIRDCIGSGYTIYYKNNLATDYAIEYTDDEVLEEQQDQQIIGEEEENKFLQ